MLLWNDVKIIVFIIDRGCWKTQNFPASFKPRVQMISESSLISILQVSQFHFNVF